MSRLLNAKILSSMAIILAVIIGWLLTSASLYPINLMSNQEVYQTADNIPGVGEVKSQRLIEDKPQSISEIKSKDTEKIHYSEVFTIRNWDLRTDALKAIFVAALIIEGVILILLNIAIIVAITVKSINLKYIRNNIQFSESD